MLHQSGSKGMTAALTTTNHPCGKYDTAAGWWLEGNSHSHGLKGTNVDCGLSKLHTTARGCLLGKYEHVSF